MHEQILERASHYLDKETRQPKVHVRPVIVRKGGANPRALTGN
jgi:hypothetical protein